MGKIKDLLVNKSLYLATIFIILLAISIEYLTCKLPLADFCFVFHDNNVNFQILFTSTVTLIALNLSMFGILTQVKSDQKFLGVSFAEAFSKLSVFARMNIKNISVLEILLFISSYIFYSFKMFNAMTFTCFSMIFIILQVITIFWELVYKKEYFYNSCYQIVEISLGENKKKDSHYDKISLVKHNIDNEFYEAINKDDFEEILLLINYSDRLASKFPLSFHVSKFEVSFKYFKSDINEIKKLSKKSLNELLSNETQYDQLVLIIYDKIKDTFSNNSYSIIKKNETIFDFIALFHSIIIHNKNEDYLIGGESYTQKYFSCLYYDVFTSIDRNASLSQQEKTDLLSSFMNTYCSLAHGEFRLGRYIIENKVSMHFPVFENLVIISRLLVHALRSGDYTIIKIYQNEVYGFRTFLSFGNVLEKSNKLLCLIWFLLIKSRLFEMHAEETALLENYRSEKIYLSNNEVSLSEAGKQGINELLENSNQDNKDLSLQYLFKLLILYSHELQHRTGHVFSQNYDMPITLVAFITLISNSIGNVRPFDVSIFDHKRTNFKMYQYFESLRTLCENATSENYLEELKRDEIIGCIIDMYKIKHIAIDSFKNKVDEIYEFFNEKITKNE
ncbi:hypothetical protein JEZ13_12540 [bacterium]|nr:hypothetical protein [bacterium]